VASPGDRPGELKLDLEDNVYVHHDHDHDLMKILRLNSKRMSY
jgi:hypothetical protein